MAAPSKAVVEFNALVHAKMQQNPRMTKAQAVSAVTTENPAAHCEFLVATNHPAHAERIRRAFA